MVKICIRIRVYHHVLHKLLFLVKKISPFTIKHRHDKIAAGFLSVFMCIDHFLAETILKAYLCQARAQDSQDGHTKGRQLETQISKIISLTWFIIFEICVPAPSTGIFGPGSAAH